MLVEEVNIIHEQNYEVQFPLMVKSNTFTEYYYSINLIFN